MLHPLSESFARVGTSDFSEKDFLRLISRANVYCAAFILAFYLIYTSLLMGWGLLESKPLAMIHEGLALFIVK